MTLVDGLFVTRIGQGRPMLCLHGGMGFDQSTLRPWLDPLADACELIFYDQRGNGRSEPPADWSAIDHATWVDDAEALRARLGLGRIVLFGHSWGGFLAQEYALKYPLSLAGLVLCSTAPALDYGPVLIENARRRGTESDVAALLAGLSTPMASDEALADFIATLAPLYFHHPSEDLIARVFGGILYRAEAFNRALFHSAPAFNTLERLPEIKVPTLLLGGGDDWIMPAEQGIERIAALVPHAEVRRFERSGHFPFVEEREEFLRVVRGWLARLG